ncbi:hypothetical protein FHT86_000567 [Rhizobium sp. BK313]|jgi:hypothetical protein|uniref:hypothetical protein n=1 Tax=Rhizobium sp. BK313 TaxID=2587081 RepID=UPI00105F4CF2|nr:hypothetical protein [Rhizobium sp. BK313]MBB3452311.1 hypothetical protein [Rhizobium sp. BK313]
MKNITSAFLAALTGARDTGLVPRRFVWITGKSFDTGDVASIGLWTGDDDIDISVISGITGVSEGRTYYGGLNLQLSPIARTADLTVQTVTITIGQIAPVAQQLLRGYDLRLAPVEIHDMTFDPVTRQPSSAPEISFLGIADGAPIKTPVVGQDGDIEISAISAAIAMLERNNPAKSSYEGQKRRSGDEFGLYSSTVANWQIPWGQKA